MFHKIEISDDLCIIIGLLAILALAIHYSQLQPLRIVLSIPLLFVLPGYVFIAALFPGRNDLSGLERAAFSIGLSIVITPLIGLGLNYSPWGIQIYALLVSIMTFIVLMMAVTLIRRIRIDVDQRYKLVVQFPLSRWKQLPPVKLLPSIVLAIAITLSIGTTAYVTATPGIGEKFTEFYVLDAQGGTGNYPFVLPQGQDGKVILGIVNHENKETKYLVEMQTDEDKKTVYSCILEHGEKNETNVTIPSEFLNKKTKIEFRLFKDGESNEYRKIHLWVDVISSDSNQAIQL